MQNRLSRQQIDRLHELADAGLSYKAIGERLGVGGNVVSYHRVKVGQRKHKEHKYNSKHVGKNKHPKHALIAKMVAQGKSYKEISEATGCCHVTVWKYKKALLTQEKTND